MRDGGDMNESSRVRGVVRLAVCAAALWWLPPALAAGDAEQAPAPAPEAATAGAEGAGTAPAPAATLEELLAGPNSEPLEAERCIRSSSIDSTDVLHSQLVVFKVGRRDIYINQLPGNCPGLRPKAKIALTSRDDRLCQLDSIRVLYPAGMGASGGENIIPGPSCMLGKFERITPEQLQVLQERFTPRGSNPLDALFD
jgi:hypothetical protein